MQFARHVELSETVGAFFFHAQLAYQETTVRSLIRLRSISPYTRRGFEAPAFCSPKVVKV